MRRLVMKWMNAQFGGCISRRVSGGHLNIWMDARMHGQMGEWRMNELAAGTREQQKEKRLAGWIGRGIRGAGRMAACVGNNSQQYVTRECWEMPGR